MEKQQIKCEFRQLSWNLAGTKYTCLIVDKIITIDSELEFIGKHVNVKTNHDVEGILFKRCTMPKITSGLTKVFPRLKYIYIHNSKLMLIERKDLRQFTDLREIWCNQNEIEYLPGDLFVNTKNLERISFVNNKIELIDANLLDGLDKLKYIDFRNNPSIDLFWNSENCSKTLQEFKNEFNEKIEFYSMKKMLRRLNQENEELRQINLKCMNKNGLYEDLKQIIQNDNLKDFVVTVNDEEFKVHKLVLAARSPVLKEMIENNIEAHSLNLIDISKDIFHEILNFIYTDELPQSDDINFIHLYVAAEHLKVENLKNFAAEKVKDKINDENAFEFLFLANKYENEELKQKSFRKVKEYYGEEITNDLASNPERLKRILAAKKKKDELMKQMNMDFVKLLKEE